MDRFRDESIFNHGLEKNLANYVPLSPLGWLDRAANIFPTRVAVIHGDMQFTYEQFRERARRIGNALQRLGIGVGDTVAIMCPNTPPMLEAHYAVPGIGAVLNPLNVRLDAATLAFILKHGEAKAVIVDNEYSSTMRTALDLLELPPIVIDVFDGGPKEVGIGNFEYEALLANGDPSEPLSGPSDEWDPLILSYTSGTTGDPKGVVYHHRGAYLNALANCAAWAMPKHPVMLWTLPIFHSLGWCFPWTISILAGTHICLRKVEAEAIYSMIATHGVTHMCGAPIVLNTLINAVDSVVGTTAKRVQVMTAASPPPPAILRKIEERGFDVLHVYGLTEVFGPSVICEYQSEWDSLSPDEKAVKKSRQGVAYPSVDQVRVVDPRTMLDVPADGATIGEVVKRSNTIMRGYLKDAAATATAFEGGYFHTGDLAVMHVDGYVELKDRLKDIIISGGENISTIEIEAALYQHPAVLEAAVVARADKKWGEAPCAFVTLKNGYFAEESELLSHCRSKLAGFKLPKSFVFGPLPKTATGKVQKFLLRERASKLDS